MASRGQGIVWSLLLMIVLGYKDVWGKTNFQNLLGLHAGNTTGVGLFYRHYIGTNFAWQISLFPTYQYFASSHQQAIYFGTMEQWFLHFTQLNTTATKGMLFVWTGGSFVYQGTRNSGETELNEMYQFSLGGGPGFEMIFYDHVIATIAAGYAASQKIPGGFTMTFTMEISCGYRF